MQKNFQLKQIDYPKKLKIFQIKCTLWFRIFLIDSVLLIIKIFVNKQKAKKLINKLVNLEIIYLIIKQFIVDNCKII